MRHLIPLRNRKQIKKALIIGWIKEEWKVHSNEMNEWLNKKIREIEEEGQTANKEIEYL